MLHLLLLFHGGIGEVWLTHRFVGPARVGSNPTYRPLIENGIQNFLNTIFLNYKVFDNTVEMCSSGTC